ncbi:hypothetical protein GVAV_000674 [Gurleya vavrai]
MLEVLRNEEKINQIKIMQLLALNFYVEKKNIEYETKLRLISSDYSNLFLSETFELLNNLVKWKFKKIKKSKDNE